MNLCRRTRQAGMPTDAVKSTDTIIKLFETANLSFGRNRRAETGHKPTVESAWITASQAGQNKEDSTPTNSCGKTGIGSNSP